MRELAQLGERRLRITPQLFEQRRNRGRIGFYELAGEPELHREGNEVLLRAVVQIALDLTSRLVGRCDDTSSRRAQLVVGDAQVDERCLQRGVQRRVVQRQRDLSRQLGEHPLFFVVEGRLLSGAGAQDDAEELARVHERRHAQHTARVLLDERREPHLHPRVALRVGAGNNLALLLGEPDRLRLPVGNCRGALEHAIGAGPHFRGDQVHAQLQ